LAVGFSAACGRDADPRRVTLKGTGALCLGAAAEADGGEGGVPAGVDLAAGQPLAISVRSPCLSNVCATERTSKCTVKRDGDRLVVASELSWVGPEELGRPCPQDCTFLEAQCKTEPLPAGDYQVVVGEQVTAVKLPSHLAVRCDRDQPPPRVAVTAAAVDAAPPPQATATPAASMAPGLVPAAPGTGVVAEPPPGDTMCVGPANPATKNRALKTGQPIAVTVLHRNACLGASCTKAPGKCTVKRKGFDLVVTAQFPTSTTKPTLPCTEDCNAIAATCRSDGLPAGTYSLDLAGHKRTIQIPAASAPGCTP
jgi:hypothetical protein